MRCRSGEAGGAEVGLRDIYNHTTLTQYTDGKEQQATNGPSH